MNIFEYHLSEIQNLILKNKKILKLDKITNLKSVNLEVPPTEFNFDLSCNIAMVLGKANGLNPKDLAEKLQKLFLENINSFSELTFPYCNPSKLSFWRDIPIGLLNTFFEILDSL